eukprot:COSAG02_NODE_357_length_23913_cov_6.793483_3_plen_36_part_00
MTYRHREDNIGVVFVREGFAFHSQLDSDWFWKNEE